jgi:Fe-S cluster assembly protein SufD
MPAVETGQEDSELARSGRGGSSGGPVLVGNHSDGRAHGPGGPSGTPSERFTSTDPDAFEVPSGREEQWRFTPSRPLRALFRSLESAAPLVSVSDAPDGASVTTVPRSHELFGSVLTPADRVSALAYARVDEALLISVAPGRVLDRPIVVGAHGQTKDLATRHVIVDIGANAHATVVFDNQGSVTLAGNVELRLGDGAVLSTVFVSDWNADAVEVTAHAALVGRDATLRHTVVNLGGSLVRIAPSVSFAGPGGQAELSGVCFAGNNQHHEVRLYVDHNEPDCTSDVLYKNALDGQSARTVWIGDVRIRAGANNTRTFELNRNLLLSDGARADSVPNLEIETGEILGAGHASATGRFDDLQLFYLQARGIPEAEARRLVVRGFFADVINRVNIPELQDRLMTTIEGRLGGAL